MNKLCHTKKSLCSLGDFADDKIPLSFQWN